MMCRLGTRLRGLERTVLLSGFLIALAGCSSMPRPDAELAGASAALMSAQNQGATQYAPVSMDRAREKLQQAEKAIQKEKYGQAKRLAEEAQADAELALATAGKEEAELAVREMEISIEVLREEIMRGQAY